MLKKNKLGKVLGQVKGFKIRQLVNDDFKQKGIGVYRGKRLILEFKCNEIDLAKKFANEL